MKNSPDFGGEIPRIYVASLASYNNGILHGEWIDCDQSVEDIQSDIAAMLSRCPEHGEEYAIHDFDLMGIQIGEYESIESVVKIAEGLSEHGAAFKAAMHYFSGVDEALEALENQYRGSYESLEAYAEEFATECGLIKDDHPLYNYVDFERYGRDLEVITVEEDSGWPRRVHVFDQY